MSDYVSANDLQIVFALLLEFAPVPIFVRLLARVDAVLHVHQFRVH
jgi:hypothetical protein